MWVSRLEVSVADHHDQGHHAQMTSEKANQTKSTLKHNTLCEEIFGHLDRFVKLRPHASALGHETYVVYRKNNTTSWLSEKSEGERNKIIGQS